MSQPAREVRPLTGGAVRSAAGQFVSAAAGALTTLVLAGILGPVGTGRYAVAFSLVIGLQTIGTLSLQVGIGYFVGRGSWAARHALVATQFAAVVLGIASFVAALLIWTLFPSAFHNISFALIAIAAAGLPFAFSWMFASAVALAVDHYELYAIPPAVQAAVGFVAMISLAAVDGVRGALLGMSLSHLAAAVLTVVWCHRALPAGESRASDPKQLRKALAFALKSHGSNAVMFVTYRLDIFILNSVSTANQVGQYAIAVSVTQAVWLLPGALSGVVMPRIAQVSSGRAAVEDDYQELVERKGVRHATILTVVSAVALIAALLVLVLVFLGPRFHESIKLGLILMPGSALLAVTAAFSSIMAGRGEPKFALLVSLITAPVAVALYLILIPSHGAVGAALASSIAYAFGFFLSLAVGRRMLGRPVLPMIVPTESELDDYRRLARSMFRRDAASRS